MRLPQFRLPRRVYVCVMCGWRERLLSDFLLHPCTADSFIGIRATIHDTNDRKGRE